MNDDRRLLWNDPLDYQGPISAAEISPCGKYRWWLSRSWQHGGDGRTLCFVMLNPSTADATADDPTIRRCIGFAQREGVSGLVVRNLFALRATDPGELITSLHSPTGDPRGLLELGDAAKADIVVAAWGAKVPSRRDRTAKDMLAHLPLYCLGTTKNGSPRHPLYVRGDQPLVVFPTADRRLREGGA